ncbi:unnamed protein product [Pelagomonas calceolata]|uniref:Telomeric single stranded DNA binding POT1/Cdc13 domain-containing protein n=1 Tax=Pelagomonas calceolata TaxID=35677 RepID=A0A8J2WWZ3_9STRA|nr:unnamed protein product [Pelagomonas calceolata]
MAEQPATALVEGEVTLVYPIRATNTEEEDNGPLASHARRVLNVEVLVDAVNERKADVFFYDELADAAARLDIERGARLWLEASPAWLRPAGEHPRMAADPLHERRRAGSVALAPRDLLMASQTPDALRAWRCCVHRNDKWDDVDQPPAKKKKREAIPAYVTYPSSDRVDKDHLTLKGCRAHCGTGMEVNVLGAVYATKPLQRGRTSNFVTLELCDADGVYTATLTAFHEKPERLPACQVGDALRCRRVVFEPPLDGDKATHLRLRGVGWSGFACFAWPARPGLEQPLRNVAVAVDYCGAKKPTPASDGLTRYAARLRGATPRAVEDDEEEAAGPCCLIDASQRRDAGPFACRCAVPAVRRDDADGRVLAARLVDDTAEVDVLVPPWANLEPSAAGVAALRAQDIRGERYLVLDSYDEAEEPYEDEFSQDVAADLYGATQVENE